MVTDHFFMDDPNHPGCCRVVVPVLEAGQTVGTCCGYGKTDHRPEVSESERSYDPGPVAETARA